MLIGNKADLISQRQVSKEEGIKIAQVRTTETTDKVSMHLFTMEIHEAFHISSLVCIDQKLWKLSI